MHAVEGNTKFIVIPRKSLLITDPWRGGLGSDDTNKYANVGVPEGFSRIFIFPIPMTWAKIKLLATRS